MNNFRLAFRVLRKSPGFTAVAVLTLALGIGINTAMFTLVNSILLHPLPYPQPDRLVEVTEVYENARGRAFAGWSYPRFVEARRHVTSFESVAAYSAWHANLTGTGNPERLNVEVVSAAYFPVLGVEAAIGRTFLEEEDRTPGTHPAAIVSHRLWQTRFGADRGVAGREIHLNGNRFTVIGVLPENFRGMTAGVDVWVPMMMAPTVFDNPRRLLQANAYWLKAIGRLRPGVSVRQAEEVTRSADPEIQAKYPAPSAMKWHSEVSSLLEAKTDPALRKSLLVLFGAVGFVLLIACANLANLLLSRSSAREKEVAVRVALGASRFALVRQFLSESFLLALAGGAAGLLVATWSADLAASLQPANGRDWWAVYTRSVSRESARMDSWVGVFNVGVSLLTALIFGLLPALRATRTDVAARLHTFRRMNLRNALIVAQVAMAVVLLSGAGLMIGSFARLLRTPLGFDGESVATFRVELPRKRYDSAAAMRFYEQVLTKIAANPRAAAASTTTALPVSGQSEGTVLGIGHEEPTHATGVHVVSPEFFSVFRVPLRQGRLLTASDRAGSPNVVVINETAARTLFPHENPVGQRITLASGWGEKGELKEIVGVVGDVKYEAPENAVEIDVYANYLQDPYDSTFIAVRAKDDPAPLYAVVKEAVASLDADLPLASVLPMSTRVAAATSRMRFSAELLGMFAIVTAFLAAIGIYGVVNYSVTSRTREIGIRMALGARAAVLLRAVALEGVALAALGVAIGIPLALFATRVLASMLYGVKPGDPATLAIIGGLLIAVALVATLIPARRAAKVDPMEALRYE